MRVTKTKIDLPGDDDLLVFALNGKPGDVTYEKLAKVGLTSTLQNEIREDILPIIAPEKKLAREEVQVLIERLLDKINDMDLRLQWQVTEFKQGDHRPVTGGIVKVQDYSWAIIRHAEISPRPKEQFLRKTLYSFVAFTLEIGKLTNLRKCGACERIFAIYDVRRKFCSDDCRSTFNNSRRLKAGYFADLRKKKRDRALLRRKMQESKSTTPKKKTV
jgi:hypothetical protein